LAFALVSALGATAAAQSGVRVDVAGVGQATAVRSLGGESILWRRYTQYVGLRGDQPLGDRDGPRLDFEGRLRIATDFGPTSAVRNRIDRPADRFSDNTIETLFVRLDELGDRADVTLGRQLRVDPLGFAHFDGGALDYRAPSGLTASVFVGAQVTEGWLGVNSADFDQDGLDRYNPAFGEPVLLQGGDVGFEGEHFRVRLGGRQGYRLGGGPALPEGFEPQTPGGQPATEQRLGGALHGQPAERVELDGDVIYNVALATFDRTAAGGVVYLPWAESWVGAGVETWRPAFRLDSIFNVFGATPQGRYRLRGGGRWDGEHGALQLESGVHWARYGDDDLSAALPGFAPGTDALGADVRTTFRLARAARRWAPTFDGWLHLRAEGGYAGTLLSARAGGTVELINQALWLWTSGQFAWMEHDLQPFRTGPLAAGSLGTSWTASRWGVVSTFAELASTADYLYALAFFGSYQLDFDLMD